MLVSPNLFCPKVLDSKGIREAVQEKNPIKAFNSFAIRDVIDGIDSPLITLEASIGPFVRVNLWGISVHVRGSFTGRVGEMSFYEYHVFLLMPFDSAYKTI